MQPPYKTRVSELFNINYPIIQAGMIWCSGWRLASAVSNAGGLGLIGSGSMYPDVLREHIQKCKAATDKPFGVNVPLLYPSIEEHMQIIIEEGVKVVFTSAGNPKTWTKQLKDAGCKVVHVTASTTFAKKAEDAGCDAVVAEGFEAGGHNGREETTTLVLIPMVADAVKIPVIAAGGIANGRGMMAALALGAEGVQVGSRFVATPESSAHDNFKNVVINTPEGGTMLSMKQLVPVRLVKNKFFTEIDEMEKRGAPIEEIFNHLGRARAKKGMFEGDLEEGELELGQVIANVKSIVPAAQVVDDMMREFYETKARLTA
jgi:enoyl-[acyl-carrier protein] reductase II